MKYELRIKSKLAGKYLKRARPPITKGELGGAQIEMPTSASKKY